ncbi:YadA C-terminal domain-containing protein [Escherichia coli]|uniref:YadA C-terminal domain-containing protein n=1 Tax=Escherichia coli TaxID=562 RepID=UPI00164F439A|nr:YadA C-terminal domain-containing protein [Escherichia coli]MBC6573310.1 hypothetical protein [Escherichia coli]
MLHNASLVKNSFLALTFSTGLLSGSAVAGDSDGSDSKINQLRQEIKTDMALLDHKVDYRKNLAINFLKDYTDRLTNKNSRDNRSYTDSKVAENRKIIKTNSDDIINNRSNIEENRRLTLENSEAIKTQKADFNKEISLLKVYNYNSINDIFRETSKVIGDVSRNSQAYTDKQTSFALDKNGNITLDESEGSGERYSVKNAVAALDADTSVWRNDDGSYTLDSGVGNRTRINDAVVDIDERTHSNIQAVSRNTLSIRENSGAIQANTKAIHVNSEAIQNNTGAIAENRQAVNKNSKAIAANTRTLQQHSARLDAQQRRIDENHKEMKRAAAQSAALSGLFQPYSVGKFNATAALGGYSDQQAIAVGVGYRFNEHTAAKAGAAFSDGEASWNMGVNFEF